jgi:hypothetical protein
MALSNQATGIVWFQPENYARLAAMFEDHLGFNSTYEEWLYAAESRRQSLERAGIKVLCVDIDPDEFPAWCKAMGMRLNAESRKAYTTYIACKLLNSVEPSFMIQ